MTAVPRAYFEQMYADQPDPWGFETSQYEQRKYAVTVASLPRDRYRSGFEPGCSIGVLTAALADRCDRLLASDVIPEVVQRATERMIDEHHVRIELRAVPDAWPKGPFDLVVLSELGYYFDRPTLDQLIERAITSLEPGGTLIAVHWRGPTDYPLTAEEVHRTIGANRHLSRAVHHLELAFLLDAWIRQ